MTRDAEMAARDFLRLVLGGLPAEDDISMVQTLLARASLAIDAYGDPAFRAQARQQLTDGVLRPAASAAPGSDQQLALLYTFATAEDSGRAGPRAGHPGRRARSCPASSSTPNCAGTC